MSKKQIALAVGGLIPVLISIIGLVVFLPQIQNPQKITNSSAKGFEKTISDPVSDQTYTDLSGFSFKYPKDVSIKDTTPNDETYYSRLNVDHKGNIITIEIKDVAKEPVYQNLVGATQLAGMSSKQYKTEFTHTTVSFDKGILYQIQLHTEDAYMTKVYEGIVSSFIIGSGSSSNSPNGDTTYEEETIE